MKNEKQINGMAAEIIKFQGGEMRINIDINRVQFFFNGKPSDDTRSQLKIYGFKWAPSEGAWQRQRTPQAIRVAKCLIPEVEE
jgi:hypothetical protein